MVPTQLSESFLLGMFHLMVVNILLQLDLVIDKRDSWGWWMWNGVCDGLPSKAFLNLNDCPSLLSRCPT